MSIRILQGDCLEVMKTLESKSISCFVCDLPYGCLNKSSKNIGCAWDVAIDLSMFWMEVERLMKDDHTPILMFCSAKFGYELIKSKEKWFRYDIIWEKANAVGFLQANKMPMRSHEMIYVFSKAGASYKRIDIKGDFAAGGGGRSTINYIPSIKDIPNTSKTTEAGRRCVRSVVKIGQSKVKGGHPTQKPDELYKWLLERYCPIGGTILDPTAGSFASCFTARAIGLHAIGIEKDTTFFKKAENALKQEQGTI